MTDCSPTTCGVTHLHSEVAAPHAGPVRAALDECWPQLADQAKYLREAIALDLAGATDRDVSRAWSALDSAARVQNEWMYFRTVVLENMSRRWPDVQNCPR